MDATFRLATIPLEPSSRRRIKAVQLCLFEHLIAEEELPALTPPCYTKEEVEEEFERAISEIRRKKEEAIAMLAAPAKHRRS